MKAFGLPFLVAGCYKFVNDILVFAGPVLLNRIIAFVQVCVPLPPHNPTSSFQAPTISLILDRLSSHFFPYSFIGGTGGRRQDDSKPLYYGLGLAAAMFVLTSIQTLAVHQYFNIGYRVGMHVRTAPSRISFFSFPPPVPIPTTAPLCRLPCGVRALCVRVGGCGCVCVYAD